MGKKNRPDPEMVKERAMALSRARAAEIAAELPPVSHRHPPGTPGNPDVLREFERSHNKRIGVVMALNDVTEGVFPGAGTAFSVAIADRLERWIRAMVAEAVDAALRDANADDESGNPPPAPPVTPPGEQQQETET